MATQTTETLTRTVLYAVELVDAVSGAPVTSGVQVQPLDAADAPLAGPPPVASRSGRLVWLQPGATWPAKLKVTPSDARYAARISPIAPPPADPVITPGEPPPLSPEQRRLRIRLAPSPAYPFEGVTAVRGALRETDGGPPVAGAVVQLAWQDTNNRWSPPLPDLSAARAPSEAVTDDRGEFAAFLEPLPANADPALDKGLMTVRLQVTRMIGGAAASRWTPETRPPVSLPDSKIPDGQLFRPDVRLSWDRLSDH